MRNNRFSFFQDLPHYTQTLLKSLFSPAILFFLILGNILLFIGTLIFYYFEAGTNPNINSFFDALWWGLSTITTVGYGDVVPTTFGGKALAMILMVVGVSFFIGFSAILFTQFMEIENQEMLSEEKKEIEYQNLKLLSKMEEVLERLNQIEAQLRLQNASTPESHRKTGT